MSGNCENLSYDNRETCGLKVSTSCSPYTGYVDEIIEDEMPDCKPNANDVFKAIQLVLKAVKEGLGDNTTLDKECLSYNPATATQKDLNQVFTSEICDLKTALEEFAPTIDAATLTLAIDILCLEEEGCDPPATYTLQELFEKLITAYCSLLTRVANIESVLNI